MTVALHASSLAPLHIGRYPTAVERLESVSFPGAELWVKRDDCTHEVYGGNKVRKLEWLLADARARGATTIVTIGAAGSHHVLATTYFGRQAGFDVEAVLVPQPRSEHALDVMRADLALGLRALPARSWTHGLVLAMRRRRRGARFITVGGSSVVGSMGYVAAARELAAQVRAGEMPEPDVCVVALGSGGTAAGLAVGLEAEGLKTRVVGVCVSQPVWALRLVSRILVRGCARRVAASTGAPPPRGRLHIDARFLGRGYGHRTAAGEEATSLARTVRLELDPTYTSKAFAAALSCLRESGSAAGGRRVVLYWHTLSSAPMQPLIEGKAPGLVESGGGAPDDGRGPGSRVDAANPARRHRREPPLDENTELARLKSLLRD